MIVKYIDSDYIINTLEKPSWKDVEEPNFFINMASNRVRAMIFDSGQGNPNDITTYTQEQQNAIKLATAIYTFWYHDTNYDFTSGSVSVNFGGASMSESKTYNGEMVLPNVYDILKQANLIPTTETFIIGDDNDIAHIDVSPKDFKKLVQEVERIDDRNIAQDLELVKINEVIENIKDLDVESIAEDLTNLKAEQKLQNENIQNNANKNNKQDEAIKINADTINSVRGDLNALSGDFDTYKKQIQAEQQEQDAKINKNKDDITNINGELGTTNGNVQANKDEIDKIKQEQQTQNQDIAAGKTKDEEQDNKIQANTDTLNKLIERLKNSNLINYAGEWVASKEYKLAQIVSYEVKLYLCKVESSQNEKPSENPTKWDLLSAPEISLDGYVTDQELQQAINKIEQAIEALKNKDKEIENKFNNYVPILGNTELDGKTFNGKASYKTAPTFNNDNEIPNIKELKRQIAELKQQVEQLIQNNNNQQNQANDAKYVNLTTNQTINGVKTFTKEIKYNAAPTNVADLDVPTAKWVKDQITSGSGGNKAEWGKITGTLSNQADLWGQLRLKQNTIKAGKNITITNGDTINAFDLLAGAGIEVVASGSDKVIRVDSNIVARKDASNTFTQYQTFNSGIKVGSLAQLGAVSISGNGTVASVGTSDSSIPNTSWVKSYVSNNAGMPQNAKQVFSNSTSLTNKNGSGNNYVGGIGNGGLAAGKVYIVQWNFYGGGNSWDTYGSFLMTTANGYGSTWYHTITKATSGDNGAYVFETQLEITSTSVYCKRYDRHSANPTMAVRIYELY